MTLSGGDWRWGGGVEGQPAAPEEINVRTGPDRQMAAPRRPGLHDTYFDVDDATARFAVSVPLHWPQTVGCQTARPSRNTVPQQHPSSERCWLALIGAIVGVRVGSAICEERHSCWIKRM